MNLNYLQLVDVATDTGSDTNEKASNIQLMIAAEVNVTVASVVVVVTANFSRSY